MLCAKLPAVGAGTAFFPRLDEIQTRPADVRAHAPRHVQAALVGPHGAERAELEAFIRQVFRRAYGAHIRHFMPQLMRLRGLDGQLLAVCGLRHADGAPLFLETYLDTPVETLIARHAGAPVARADIVEIGNLAVAAAGEVRPLLASLSAYLHRTHTEWAVFTATPLLRNSLRRLNMPLQTLGQAELARIAPHERADWGRYYDKTPLVMALHRAGPPPAASEGAQA